MDKSKIKEIRNAYLNNKKVLDILLDKSYDFDKLDIDEDVFFKVSGYEVNKEIEKIKKEAAIQDLIIYKAKLLVLEKYVNADVLNHKLKCYEGFYFIEIGNSFDSFELTFYKNGDALNFVSKSDGWIDVIDDRNYFIFEKKNNQFNAVHKRIDSTKTTCFNVSIINEIGSSILKFNESNNLIGWKKSDNLETKVLYNYRDGKILIPEFNHFKSDYGLFSNLVDREGLFHIVTSYNYGNSSCNLEYLIDKDGILCTDVYDFARNVSYSLKNRGDTQLEVLNSIFDEAYNNLKKESGLIKNIYSKHIYSKKRKIK